MVVNVIRTPLAEVAEAYGFNVKRVSKKYSYAYNDKNEVLKEGLRTYSVN